MKPLSRVVLGVLLVLPGVALARDTALDQLKTDLMCPCPCSHQLGQCGDECGYAPPLIAEIETLLETRSQDEIVSLMEARYGREILAAPRAEGWGLLAWILPPIVVLCGGLLLWGFLRSSAQPVAAPQAGFSPEEERRLRGQLQRELHQD